MPQSRITVLGQEGRLHCSSGLPHCTPNLPSSFNHQWKLWWPHKEAVSTLDSAPKHELVLTAVSITQRTSHQILHYKMCIWLLPLFFAVLFFSLHRHACMRSALSVSYCSNLLKSTPAETQGKDSSQTIAIWGTFHFTSIDTPYLTVFIQHNPLDYLDKKRKKKSKRSKRLRFWIDYAENNEINPPKI